MRLLKGINVVVIIDSAMSKRVKGRRGTEPLSWKSELAECICQRRQEHKEDSGVGHDSGQVELRFLSSLQSYKSIIDNFSQSA